MKVYIQDIGRYEGQEVMLEGWLANKRTSKGLVFLVFRDGTGFMQCVVSEKEVSSEEFDQADKLPQESSLAVVGRVVKDEKQEGGYELHVNRIQVYHIAKEYPITNKEHGVDFLMDHRHLWLRSRRQWAIMRIRNAIIMAIHEFLQGRGFIQMDAPIFTGNACEGTSTLFETDFYGDPAYLSQSGQLYGEAMAFAHNLIYTFGPTFRAEKSKTRRHLSEFWMIEPEMAFYDLAMNMDLIEAFLQHIIAKILDRCPRELQMIGRDTEKLRKATGKFVRMTYEEAVQILKGQKSVNGRNAIDVLEDDLRDIKARIEELQKEIAEREVIIAQPGKKKVEINHQVNKIALLRNEIKDLQERAENIPQWIESARQFREGNDFGGSDETVITRLFDTPIMIYNWPHEVKAFYMKRDEHDPRWAKGVDVLAPEGYGEIVGGGERETNLDLLIEKIREHNLPMQAFEWYLDLRRYGSVKHAGFGLGLERLVAYICGLQHVRETIPFPRMYGRLLP